MTNDTGERRVFAFGEFRLDLDRAALLKGRQEIPLRPQSLAVLRMLLERHGRLVSRDEIQTRVWGHRLVTDDSLTQCLGDIRKALGDESHTIIRTVPKQGFIIEVAVTLPDEARPRKFHVASWQYAAAVALVLAAGAYWGYRAWTSGGPMPARALQREADVKSIAVLPFIDLSADGNQAFLADGIAEEIISRLQPSPSLRVIARTSSFSFRGRGIDIAEITRKLKVTHVLEGSIRRSGDRIRVTAQLIETADSSHLWSQTYDRALGDLFTVQDEIAAAVADALRLALAGDGRGSGRPPANHQAYEHFLQGRFFFHRRATGDLAKAREQFERAVQLDPDYAPSWTALAGVYSILMSDHEVPRGSLLDEQREALERALTLDPDLAEAHARAGRYYHGAGDFQRSAQHFRRARELDPQNPIVLSDQVKTATWQGRFDEAVELGRQIVAQDPLSTVYRRNLSNSLLAAGRLAEARTEILSLRELHPTLKTGVHDQYAILLLLELRFDEALAQIEAWPDGAFRVHFLALAYWGLGRQREADAALQRLSAIGGVEGAVRNAEVHAHRGEIDQCFAWLETARERAADRHEDLVNWLLYARESAFLSRLQDDARWKSWFAAMEPYVTWRQSD